MAAVEQLHNSLSSERLVRAGRLSHLHHQRSESERERARARSLRQAETSEDFLERLHPQPGAGGHLLRRHTARDRAQSRLDKVSFFNNLLPIPFLRHFEL